MGWTIGAESLSVIVTCAPCTVRPPPSTVPTTITVSAGSCRCSSSGVRVSVAVPLVWFAAMVSVAVPAV